MRVLPSLTTERPLHSLAALILALACSTGCFAQERTVAITVDDLPYASGDSVTDGGQARAANGAMLAAFRRHHVPVTGFVIQNRVDALGPDGPRILGQWIRSGFDLANHTYSHPDINTLAVEQIEEEIVKGERAIAPLMNGAGKKLGFFRFPMNHTGDTREKHDVLAAFLKQRGYRLATCTIDNSDYLYNAAYVRILAKADHATAKKLREEYVAYTATEIDYYAGLNKQALGYEPPHVMLLHVNRLNADTIEAVLKLFTERHYRFVSLAAAQSDPAYQIPETHFTKFGPMWGYRWAWARGVKVDGSLEKEPSKWVADYPRTR